GLPKTGSSVGVDVGLKDFAILSTGEVFSNPKWFRKLDEAKNYQKQKRKVACIHENITNARTDYLQKISTY
ncbi:MULTISPECIES: transposase, partial [Bacillus cereus group]|uniref:transposase n=1 Tax=Bacillus cereus group TaxID=86661 RepID=UPI001F58D68E